MKKMSIKIHKKLKLWNKMIIIIYLYKIKMEYKHQKGETHI